MSEKFYTDEQIIRVKKQWSRLWIAAYGFLVFIGILSLILFACNKLSEVILKDVISKIIGKGVEGYFFGYLPLYYCAYVKPGIKWLGCVIVCDTILLLYDLFYACYDCIGTSIFLFQSDFTLINCVTIGAISFGMYFLLFFWKVYAWVVFYRLYQLNLFLQKQEAK
ncbi:MAG: hypothetical protein JO129_03985 [Candidatus Dependentiae bacterium]|nr:hypothetical protein [Candidatus Dependentiae bacterium]